MTADVVDQPTGAGASRWPPTRSARCASGSTRSTRRIIDAVAGARLACPSRSARPGWPPAAPAWCSSREREIVDRFRAALGADGTQLALLILRAGRGPL